MFGTFGDITFDILTAPQSFSIKKETEFAEHARINNKPKLQKTGEKLDDLSIQLQFHKAFCTPESEVAKFENLRKSATINSFLLGTGEFIGSFVISAINKTITDAFDNGALLCVTLDVTFKEAVSSSPLTDMATAAVASAFAVSADTPLPTVPSSSIEASPAAQILESVSAATIGTQLANTEIAKAAKSVDYIERASSTIAKATQGVTDALNKVDTVLSGAAALQQMASGLGAAVTAAKANATTLAGLMPIENIDDVKNSGAAMRDSMKVVSSASAPIATVSAYRGIF
jgi:phage protein U